MGPNKVERLINAIRSSQPHAHYMYRYGCCYNFFLILRSVFPQAQPYYSLKIGHVYTLIDGRFYDIEGKCLNPPKDLTFLYHNIEDKPHRWSARFNWKLKRHLKKLRT